MKDYYRTLGVLDDAEDIIIRAAYKALAQRYHPDKWKGDLTEATNRMSAINEAYDTLSNSEKRKKYDEEYFRYKARDESTEEDDLNTNFISEEDEAWLIACEFFPKIKDEFIQLGKISGILANTFRAILIDSQDYKSSTTIKNKIEADYLKRYYGSNENIRKFSKYLLLYGFKAAAIKVNKYVRTMGESIGYKEVADRILQEFPDVKLVTEKIYLIEAERFLRSNSLSPREIIKCIEILDKNSNPSLHENTGFWGATTVYKFTQDGKLKTFSKDEISSYLFVEIRKRNL